MEGMRVSFGNELDIVLLLNYLFEPYTSYVINQVLMRIVAFIGMYLLLNRYVFINGDKQFSVLISLLFALLPFYPYGLGVPGLPLITYIFLNIRSNEASNVNWVVLILFPLYSSFVHGMMFFIILLSVLWIYDLLTKRVSKHFTIALVLFGITYLLINYRLLDVFIFGNNDFISHRTERISNYYNFHQAIVKSIHHFLFGQYHAYSLHIIFLPFIMIILLLNSLSKNRDKLLLGLFLLNIIISVWYGFWKYEGWQNLRESLSLLNLINLSRFTFITPLIWYVLLALSIKYYINTYKHSFSIYLVNIIICLSLIFIFYRSDFIQEYRSHGITYKEFFAQNLFDKVERYIGKDKNSYKVLSLGIHPAIASYNGFYTIDGYLINYNIEYKHRFRKIISRELSKNQKLKKNFDNWGSRCYLYINEVGYNFIRKKDEVYPINVDLNVSAIHSLSGKYIFSSYPIVNYEENGLSFLQKFHDKDSAWDIYLYKIKRDFSDKLDKVNLQEKKFGLINNMNLPQGLL
jgi:hypothetical protein